MKTTLRTIGMLLVAVMVSFAMTACGDDDKKDDNEPDLPGTSGNRDSELVGSWKLTASYDDKYEDEDQTFVFNKNGTCTYTERYENDSPFIMKGKWETAGNYLFIEVTSCTQSAELGDIWDYNYVVDGNVLYLDRDVYRRI